MRQCRCAWLNEQIGQACVGRHLVAVGHAAGYPDSAVWWDNPDAIFRLAGDGPMQGQDELPFLVLVLGYFCLIVIEVEANSEGRTIRLVEINVIVARTQQFCGLDRKSVV